MKVGFIGLGMMGSRMATNVGKAGYQLMLYDMNKNIGNIIKKQVNNNNNNNNITIASSTEDIANNSNIIVTMVPASKEVKEVLLGNNGILNRAKAGSLITDCSTIDPDVSVELNNLSENKDIAMIDAPVSGGVNGAEAATLTFMVGGTSSNVDRAKPLLEVMGKKIVHCGGIIIIVINNNYDYHYCHHYHYRYNNNHVKVPELVLLLSYVITFH